MKLRSTSYVMGFALVAAAGLFGGGIGSLTMPAAPVAAPAPRMLSSESRAEVIMGPDTTVKIVGRFFLRNMTTKDTLVVTYYRNDSVQTALTRKRTFTNDSPNPTDSAFVQAQGYGKTASFKQCGQIKSAKGRTIPSGLVIGSNCWSYTWTRDSLPDPVIDSVKQIVVRPGTASVKPTLAGMEPGDSNKVQFCSFAVLKSGRRVKTSSSWNIPACEEAYQSWLSESQA